MYFTVYVLTHKYTSAHKNLLPTDYQFIRQYDTLCNRVNVYVCKFVFQPCHLLFVAFNMCSGEVKQQQQIAIHVHKKKLHFMRAIDSNIPVNVGVAQHQGQFLSGQCFIIPFFVFIQKNTLHFWVCTLLTILNNCNVIIFFYIVK